VSGQINQEHDMAGNGTGLSSKHAAAILAVLAIIVAGYFGFRQLVKSPTQPSPDVGREVAESFLASVRSGKAGEAWDAASTEFKSIEGRESFMRRARSAAILTGPLQFNSTQQVLIQEEPRSEYLFQSPDAKVVRVLLGYERGDWRVDRLSF
jgi:hypothetical protein